MISVLTSAGINVTEARVSSESSSTWRTWV